MKWIRKSAKIVSILALMILIVVYEDVVGWLIVFAALITMVVLTVRELLK